MEIERATPTDAEIDEMLKQAEQEAGVAALLEAYDLAESIYAATAQHMPETNSYASNTTAVERPAA
jgi:hypothetical protein